MCASTFCQSLCTATHWAVLVCILCFTLPLIGSWVLWWLCLCVHVSLSASISLEAHYSLHQNFCACYQWLWQRSGVLCSSGFIHNVMFANNGPEYRRWNKGVYLRWLDRGQHRFDTMVYAQTEYWPGGGVWYYLWLLCLAFGLGGNSRALYHVDARVGMYKLTMDHVTNVKKLKLCDQLLHNLQEALDLYEQVCATLLEEELSYCL